MQDKIINGSFKGIPIAITEASLSGGRKHAVKQFPNRDTQSVEDLGAQPRKYVLEIIVGKKGSEDYFAYRNSLIAALETKGSGVLIHPLYGRIEGIVAVSYSLNERFASFGDSTISVSFELDGNLGIPQATSSVITQVSAAKEGVLSAVKADIEQGFSLTNSFAGNFAAATGAVTGIADKLTEASSFITDTAATALPQVAGISDKVAEFTDKVDKYAADANSLVLDAKKLADRTVDINQSMIDKYETGQQKLQAARNMFNFGGLV